MMHEPNEHETTSVAPRRFTVSVGFWLSLAAFVLAGLAAGLSLWMPHHQMRRAVAEIESRGGVVQTRSATPGWFRHLTGHRIRMLETVVLVDLTSGEATDETLSYMAGMTDLQRLDLAGPAITDAGLEHLHGLTGLRALVLINCPEVSIEAVERLETSLPHASILLRGPALLGIAGTRHPHGCLVLAVQPGSAADRAGLRFRDVITRFDGEAVGDFEPLARLIAAKRPDETVVVEIERHGRRMSLEATLGNWSTVR